MRNTRQRKAIQRVFEEAKSPLTIYEVLEDTSKHVEIGIATLYRNIKRLLDDEEIIPVDFPGEPTRYEKAGKHHHHHFQCRKCQRVFEVEGCASNLKELVPSGFTLEHHEILLYGLCKKCNVNVDRI